MNKIGLTFRAMTLGAMVMVLAACGSGFDSAGDLAVSAKSAPTAVSPGSPASFVSAPIPGRYIVVFKNTVGNPAAEAANVMLGLGGQVHFTYTHAIKGFAATIPEAALQGILRNPNVDYVEQDQTVSANADQPTPTWGLDRIDQRDLPLDNNYHYNYTGAGVHAFIIDTGIRSSHGEFADRWQQGKNFVAKNWRSAPDANDTEDCNGHGTHVAATVGGTTYGVAKGVTLIPVRVLDCRGSGSWTGVIAGIDYVAGIDSTLKRVANMSLGGGASQSVDDAVDGAVTAGVTMVVAAGNDGANACNYSPARAASAITVGATGSSDARTSWSNYGSCVDIFAPGLGITSAWNTSDTATNTISGTSMASPHVTGVAALALASGASTPAAVANAITSTATPGVVGSPGTGSPNLLLYSLLTDTVPVPGPGPGDTDPAVTATITNPSAKKIGRSSWRMEATVTIKDTSTSSSPVENATVSGTFAYSNTSETRSCITGTGSSAGLCTMTSAMIGDRKEPAEFTVTGVAGKTLQSCSPSDCKVTISYQ